MLVWLLGLATVGFIASSVALPLPDELKRSHAGLSVRVEASNGELLREVRPLDGVFAQWLKLEQCPPLLREALVRVEDRFYYYHPGVNPLSLLRATLQALYHGRVVSGASTLSMQLARRLRPHPRNLAGKIAEMALALRLEAQLTKSQILEAYLNRVDFGPNLRGVAAAAQGYFGKPVAALSLGEIALLAGLPQSPSGYAPKRHLERTLARREQVLRVLESQGVITAVEAAQAKGERVQLSRSQPAFGAPHFVTALVTGALEALQPNSNVARLPEVTKIVTTLDPTLQEQAEFALTNVLSGLRDRQVTAAALLAVDNATGDILAYVGSPNFYDDARQGQIDGVRAKRQPGSALKPFVYAAAIEQLGYTAATVLPDLELTLETQGGPYRPRNFDGKFHGPVRLREALGNSLNVPAVRTAAQLGSAPLLDYLHRLGFSSLKQPPEFYGPALALGDGEVTLFELVRAYVTLAREGSAISLRAVSSVVQAGQERGFPPDSGTQVIPRSVAALLTDILKDPKARLASFGSRSALDFEFEVAAKTGTSKGFRDNWAIGYTGRITVGVWVGNFDGSPMQQVSGVTGAGPILHAVLLAAEQARRSPKLPFSPWDDEQELTREYALKRVELCPLSGLRRAGDCPHGTTEYVPATLELPSCDWHRRLLLDRRNGLLAGPDCPSAETTEQSFEILPDPYAAWAKSLGRAKAPESFSANCPAKAAVASGESVFIESPKDGSQLVIDPERAPTLQQLRLEAFAAPSVRKLTCFVDDRPFASSGRPFECFWQLEPGTHRFFVETETGERSKPIELVVRAAVPSL